MSVFFLYLPFGESMAQQNAAGCETPYKFTGKVVDADRSVSKQDAETGLCYFGARYYDPHISLWMSVDPLAEKYPGWSPYNYTLNNPLKSVDPDGGFPIDAEIARNFPKISAYLQKGGGLEKYITGSPRMLSTLSFYSSGFLTKEQIHSDFESTKTPKIHMVSNDELKARGFDCPNDFEGHWEYTNSTIELGEAFLFRIESLLNKVEGNEKLTASVLMEFTSTFINEYTHYGDYQDGFDMQLKDRIWQNIGIEPDFRDDEGNRAAELLFPFTFGKYNYEMYKEGLHKPNNQDDTMIPKID